MYFRSIYKRANTNLNFSPLEQSVIVVQVKELTMNWEVLNTKVNPLKDVQVF